jgi:hypothetical protein
VIVSKLIDGSRYSLSLRGNELWKEQGSELFAMLMVAREQMANTVSFISILFC